LASEVTFKDWHLKSHSKIGIWSHIQRLASEARSSNNT